MPCFEHMLNAFSLDQSACKNSAKFCRPRAWLEALDYVKSHPEVFEAIESGTELLLDDGKVRLRVVKAETDFAETDAALRVDSGAVSFHVLS